MAKINYKKDYALDWMDKYAPPKAHKYWLYKKYFIPVLDPVDADDDFSFADLSVVTGKSTSELKSTLQDDIDVNLYSSTF